MVHHSNARLQVLSTFILEATQANKSCFEVSDVKRDGTVFVKFRSSPEVPSLMLAKRFRVAMQGRDVVQTTEVQFRLALDQFAA